MKRYNCVLLIDDDEITNFINVNLLEDMDITNHIEIATNGQEALDFLRSHNHCPELILLDINMPLLDGFEFLEQFNEMDLPGKDQSQMIALTTSNNPKDIDKLKKYGVEQLINKPLTRDNLGNHLQDADV